MAIDKEESNIGAHAVLVTPGGKIILQQRENKPEILSPGKIATFGGTLRSGESVLKGLRRELLEELGLNIDDYKVERLNIYRKTKEIDGIDWTSYMFVVKNVNVAKLKLHEGLGFFVDTPESVLKNPNLTRICRLAVSDYLKTYL